MIQALVDNPAGACPDAADAKPAPTRSDARPASRRPRRRRAERDANPRRCLRHLPRLTAEADPGDLDVTDDGDAIDARIAAMLPPQLLQPSEIIILLLKPSPLFIILSCAGFLIGVLAVASIGLLLINAGHAIGIDRRELITAAVAVCFLRLCWQFLEWLSRVYVLTDLRVIRVQGVLRVQVFETPLKRVQHTHTLFSIRERLFNLGTIGFATAGTGHVEAAWQMVARPLEVHRIVVQTLNRYR